MTNPGRKRRKRKTVLGVFFRLFFVLQPEPELLPKYFVHIRIFAEVKLLTRHLTSSVFVIR